MAFFKHCWEVANTEVIATIQNFHERDIFERSFSATYVALIPKKVRAKELKDFRHISLIGSIYKIISKLLTERLKKGDAQTGG
uniref:Putative ovule protein n=1 Tax=Solanum chacoense TaxID=4108 RepID=A0A0V0HDH8_SOLCH